MEAMEKLWAKREKAEEMREIKKKERNNERLTVETRRLEIKQQVENRKLDLMQ
jgi:exosome complex RNA-binding protein Rrp42 (RNase PH superfamily)